ncbi:MAG: DUF3150 domain-containing protein, partial [Desulfuromonadaceae bacterium]
MSLVAINISLWQGRKTLHKDDLPPFGINVAKLPQKTVAALGTKKIVSPATLKVFNSLRREALKICLNNGVRFVGDGYAVPRSKVAELCLKLKQLKAEFETAKGSFLEGFDEEVKQWITKHRSEWIPLIGAAVNSKQQINKALTFNYAALDVMVPEDIADHGVDGEVIGLYGQLCSEVRLTARQAYQVSFVGKEEISNKALRPIKAIRAKLEGFSFLHSTIDDTIEAIDDVLTKLPKKGVLTGADLALVAGLVGRELANLGRDDDGNTHIEEADIVPEKTGRVAPIAWDF